MTWRTFEERLLSGLVIMPDGCLEWTGYRGEKGYGQIRRDGKKVRTHRAMYEMFVGPIPDGMQLDHLCRNPACANVAHLEPVTTQVNTQRGLRGVLLTACRKGHPLAWQKRASNPSGHARYCPTCDRDRKRAERARQRTLKA